MRWSIDAIMDQLTIEVASEHGDAVTNFLFEQGSSGVLEEDCGSGVRLKAYFDGPPPIGKLESYTQAIGASTKSLNPLVRPIEPEDWANSWRDHFTPLLIGERLFVCPPWTTVRPADRLVLVIDPGMAFGTGHHATTRMCLELSESTLARHEVGNAIDLGSGSGILAIGLAKLGVPDVCAVEIDPVAREAAAVNAVINAVDKNITAFESFAEVSQRCDLLVANLFTNLLIALAPRIVDRVNPGGTVVVSGFIDNDAAQVEAALCTAGLRLLERRSEDRWVAFALERP